MDLIDVPMPRGWQTSYAALLCGGMSRQLTPRAAVLVDGLVSAAKERGLRAGAVRQPHPTFGATAGGAL